MSTFFLAGPKNGVFLQQRAEKRHHFCPFLFCDGFTLRDQSLTRYFSFGQMALNVSFMLLKCLQIIDPDFSSDLILWKTLICKYDIFGDTDII